MQKKQKGLVWFRNDLRVNDNESLTNAMAENKSLIAMYCFDPRHFEQTSFGFKKNRKIPSEVFIRNGYRIKGQSRKNEYFTFSLS